MVRHFDREDRFAFRGPTHQADNESQHPAFLLEGHVPPTNFDCGAGGSGRLCVCVDVPLLAKLVHCMRTVCSADTMKPSQGGREETPMHLCSRHKGLHILGDWWPTGEKRPKLGFK